MPKKTSKTKTTKTTKTTKSPFKEASPVAPSTNQVAAAAPSPPTVADQFTALLAQLSVLRSQVTSINGNVCSVSGFNSVPTSSNVWLLVNEASEKHFRRYRVQSVKDNSDGTYEVIGILYTDRKFEYVETGDLDLGNTYNSFKRKKVEAITPNKISFSIRNT